jgi:GAF domain-containing protein/HAMP domain-containing protein
MTTANFRPWRLFSNASLRVKLVIATIAIAALAMLAVGVFVYDRSRSTADFLSDQLLATVRQQGKEQLTNTLNREATVAQQFLQTAAGAVETAANYVGSLFDKQALVGRGDYWNARRQLTRLPLGQWDNPNTDAASVLIRSDVELTDRVAADTNTAIYLDFMAPGILQNNPNLVALYFVNPDGVTVYYPNINLAEIVGNYDPSSRPYFTEAAPDNNPQRKTIWTAPYQDAALTGLVVTVSAPVYDGQGKFRGVVAADLQLAQITAQVASLVIAKTGYAFLVDSAGHPIAMPPAGYRDFDLKPETVPVGASPSQTVLGAGSAGLQALTAQMVGGASDVTTFTLNGAEYYLAYTPLSIADYRLGVIVPVNELDATYAAAREQVNAQRQTTLGVVVLIFSVLLAATALASFGIGRTLTTPLGQLTDAAQHIASGDFNRAVSITTHDEIGLLAGAFNSMTARLRSLIGSLEQQVERRTSQLRASAEVGRAAASILDPDELLRTSVELITARFGFYYAAIFTLDDSGQWAVLREATGEAGRTLKERGHRLEVGGHSMVGYVTARREMRIAHDVGRDAVRFANPLLPESRSEIALPLVVGQRVLGALDVQSQQAAAFDDASAATLQSMADQIAIALNNAEQFSQTEQQARAQRALLEASLELTGESDRAMLLEKAARHAAGLTQADGVNVYLPVNDDEIELVFADDPIARPYTGQRLKKGEGLSGRAYASARSQRVDDYASWPGRASAYADADFHAVLAVPMIWHGRSVGVLTLTRGHNHRPFTPDDENVLSLLGAQVAAALVNADLAEQQRRTLEELDVTNRRLTGKAWASLLSQSADQIQRVQVARHNLPAPAETPPDVELALTQDQAVQWHSRPDGDAPFKAGLAAPIVLRGEIIGALGVEEAQTDRVWSEADRALIQAVANEVAIAVDNARLIEQTERRAQRERLIAEITRKMLSAGDLNSIVQIAGQELGRALQLDRAQVLIGAEVDVSERPARSNGHDRSADQEAQA